MSAVVRFLRAVAARSMLVWAWWHTYAIMRGHDYGPVAFLVAGCHVAYGAWLCLPGARTSEMYLELTHVLRLPVIWGLSHVTIGLAEYMATLIGPSSMPLAFTIGAVMWAGTFWLSAFFLSTVPLLYFSVVFTLWSLWIAHRAGTERERRSRADP